MTAVTKWHAASREALAAAEHRLEGVLGSADAQPARVADDLSAVARLLAGELSLRRAIADTSAADEARKGLLRSLTEGKVTTAATDVLDTVATSRWSNPRELLDGLRMLASTALLIGAEADGTLDAVEDELFGVARVVAGQPELDRALSDQAAPADARQQLVRDVFAGKVSTTTQTLVEHAVAADRGRGVGHAVDELSELAARRRDRSVAHVTTASPLTDAQQRQLGEKLNRIYGREIAVHVDVRPDVIGGIVVRVGDEVIDGTSAGRIMALRGRMAG